MHKAWCNVEEVPYSFSRSSIKFPGHTGWRIDDLNRIWVRLLGLLQLSNPSDLPCYSLFCEFNDRGSFGVCAQPMRDGVTLLRHWLGPYISIDPRILLHGTLLLAMSFTNRPLYIKDDSRFLQFSLCYIPSFNYPLIYGIFNCIFLSISSCILAKKLSESICSQGCNKTVLV